MTYKLFIDDERFPATDGWTIARSSKEAFNCIFSKGIPQHISFDHDLGGDDTSMVFLKQLEECLHMGNVSFPEGFSYYVHSQNPIGAGNIKSYMDNLLRFYKESP